MLDFLVAPAYVNQAADLLVGALDALAKTGAERVRVYLASCDDEKAELARKVGFRHEATLVGQFRVGDQRHDLEIYARALKEDNGNGN